jgi:hypothetical protein
MPKRAIVGKSGVTPCKHDLLNKLLGREVGTLKANKLGLESYLIVDLTAGDGVPYTGKTFRKGCSPGNYSASRGVRCRANVGESLACLLLEKQAWLHGSDLLAITFERKLTYSVDDVLRYVLCA